MTVRAAAVRRGVFLAPILLVVALQGGCTLPQGQGTSPMAQNGEVGVPNLNPAARGPMYYRYIPSAAHQIGPDFPFPGPSYTQSQSLISVSGLNGTMVMRGVGQFVDNFYAGGFPAVQASVERCYALSNHYFLDEYGFMLGQAVPCLAEDDTAYFYNLLLTKNWGFPPYHYFEVVPFARRNLTELRIARQNLASSEKIMRQISHDIEIVLPTEIELPVAMDRP